MRRSLVLSLLVVIAIVALALLGRRLALGQYITQVVEFIRDAGAWGLAAFVVLYVVSALVFVPGSWLTMAAGFAYGPIGGLAASSVGSVVAALAPFLIARYVARARIAAHVATNRRFAVVDHVVARDAFRIVTLLRLSPLIPFAPLNYMLGLTRVSLRDYVVASWIGMMPVTAAYAYLGSLITSLAGFGAQQPAQTGGGATRVLYWVGLAATALVAVLITRAARRALASELGRDAQALESDAS